MAQYVIAGAQAADAATQSVVGIADAAAHIEDVVRSEAAKNKEAMRQEDNEFNIRKNFLDNAVAAIQTATVNQFNIVVCTNQEKDDFQDLQGRILPMDLLNLEISQGKFVDFEVYVFDTGKYLRHGKYERDYWNYWGNDKPWYDPAAMHVHFTKAQKKLDPTQIKRQQDDAAAKAKTADDAKKAAAAASAEATKNEATTLKTEADKKKADAAAQAQGQGNPEVGADPGITRYNGSGSADPSAGGAMGGMGGMMGGMMGGDPNQGTQGGDTQSTQISLLSFPRALCTSFPCLAVD